MKKKIPLKLKVDLIFFLHVLLVILQFYVVAFDSMDLAISYPFFLMLLYLAFHFWEFHS